MVCFIGYSSNPMLTVQTDDVIIDIDGNSLVGPKETLIILDFVSIFSLFLSQKDIFFLNHLLSEKDVFFIGRKAKEGHRL